MLYSKSVETRRIKEEVSPRARFELAIPKGHADGTPPFFGEALFATAKRFFQACALPGYAPNQIGYAILALILL